MQTLYNNADGKNITDNNCLSTRLLNSLAGLVKPVVCNGENIPHWLADAINRPNTKRDMGYRITYLAKSCLLMCQSVNQGVRSNNGLDIETCNLRRGDLLTKLDHKPKLGRFDTVYSVVIEIFWNSIAIWRSYCRLQIWILFVHSEFFSVVISGRF